MAMVPGTRATKSQCPLLSSYTSAAYEALPLDARKRKICCNDGHRSVHLVFIPRMEFLGTGEEITHMMFQ